MTNTKTTLVIFRVTDCSSPRSSGERYTCILYLLGPCNEAIGARINLGRKASRQEILATAKIVAIRKGAIHLPDHGKDFCITHAREDRNYLLTKYPIPFRCIFPAPQTREPMNIIHYLFIGWWQRLLCRFERLAYRLSAKCSGPNNRLFRTAKATKQAAAVRIQSEADDRARLHNIQDQGPPS